MTSLVSPKWSRARTKNVYFLKEGSLDEREILGLKGGNLCEMFRIGLPVPPGFIVSSQCCLNYQKEKELSKALVDDMKAAVYKLEAKTGKRFGGGPSDARPLLLSVRSSAAVSMPGMMQTVLNLGVNSNIVQALTQQTNNSRWALMTHMKFLESFGTTVLGVDPARYQQAKQAALDKQAAPLETLFSMEDLQELIGKYKLMAAVPDDPWEQLAQCVEAAFKSWFSPRAAKYRDVHSISENMGAAVTVQAMVFGNINLLSGAGVVTTRNPTSGEKKLYGAYLANAEGDELVTRVRMPMLLEDLHTEQPDVYGQLEAAVLGIERHYKDAQEVEFTVEDLRLFVLETVRAKRSPRAAVRIAVDMVDEGILTQREALLRVDPKQLNFFMHPMVDDQYWSYKETHPEERVLGRGKAAGGGAVVGLLVFTAQQAMEYWNSQQQCILARPGIGLEDISALKAADGVLTLQGGLSSHAAVTMRSLNKSAVADLEAVDANWESQTLTSVADPSKIARAGDKITIDGSTGRVYLGEKPITLANQDANFQTVMLWAQRYKRLGVQAAVTNKDQVTTAMRLGAEGVGLYDTEEMFLEDDRLDLFRRWILAETYVERRNWSLQLLPLLQERFLTLFHLLGNCELSVLLLDPPLSTFLPDIRSGNFEEQLREIAERLSLDFDSCQRRVLDLQESNPMLGFRGCRLSVVYPEITDMQVRAIVGAAVELKRRNFPVLPKIILPLSFSEQEVDRVAAPVCTVSDSVCASAWEDASSAVQVLQHKIACMIETPRACYKTDAIARVRHVTDVILNTDTLTSLVFGMVDDCTEGFMHQYLDHHLVARDPFRVLDENGVGSLLLSSVQRARQSNTGVKVGVAGAHAGEPLSIAFLDRAGVDFLVCSPCEVPAAKVAAAQAAIRADLRSGVGKKM